MRQRNTVSIPDIQDLSTLAEQIREAHRAVQAAGVTALHRALDAGDALSAAQNKISAGNWKTWLCDNCFLSVRTALLYQQLARHREQIEAEIERATHLSLRAARRLITKPRSKIKKKAKSQLTLLDCWKRAAGEERTALLDHIGVDGIRKAGSLAFYRALVARLRIEKIDASPDATITNLVCKALSHMASADQTTGAVADSNINEALNSLRAVLKKLGAIERTYHDLSIGFVGKAKARRAA